MCGVVAREGVLDPKLRASIGAMTATLRHRGPDGQSVFTHDAAALGHRRLAIIDRAGGTQPMTNEDESCWIVFNGEIYNHRALRRRLLDRGHTFRTTSDTESILHAYEEFGTDCVRMLEGMFAFAVYDTRRRELLMARDRLGKKPLYYAELGGALHFASEIKAIRTSPVWDPTINLPQLEQYLSLGYFVAPTIVEHVGANDEITRSELFGPITCLYRVKDFEEAVTLANDSPFGLGGSVYSSDIERAKRVASRIETGMVFINYPDVSWPDLPFGGIKRSGYGKELSNLGIEEFVNKKLVLVPNIPA